MRRWAPIAAFVISVIPAVLCGRPQSGSAVHAKTVRPTIAKYCIGCHRGSSPAAQLDLKSYSTVDAVTRDFGSVGPGDGQAHGEADAAPGGAAAARCDRARK